jgi:hypothetical protein
MELLEEMDREGAGREAPMDQTKAELRDLLERRDELRRILGLPPAEPRH